MPSVLLDLGTVKRNTGGVLRHSVTPLPKSAKESLQMVPVPVPWQGARLGVAYGCAWRSTDSRKSTLSHFGSAS